MALRKFLFMNQTEGFSQEQAASDELSLGKITLSGVSGVALDVGGQLISNLGAPVGSADAARKVDVQNAQTAAQTYTDNLASSLTSQFQTALSNEATARAAADTTLQTNIDNEASARAAADTTLTNDLATEVSRAQAAESAEASARAAADSQLSSDISAEASARAAADTQLASDLSSEVSRAQSAESSLSSAISAEATRAQGAESTIAGNLSSEISRAQSAEASITSAYQAAVSAEASARVAGDASTLADAKAYADSLQSGFIVKMPAKAIAASNISLSGAQTIDGVALVAGDRVLVAGQTDATQNGIYVVASGAWSRASDLDTNAEMLDGVSVFIEQGSQYSDSTWVLITNNPIVIGTTDITFVQFSGLGQITAGDGLSKTGNRLDVNVGDGIAIAADAVAVDLAGVPGLQFLSGKLAAKPDATRALDVDGSGLYVVADSAKALNVDASAGLQVKADSSKGLGIDGTTGLQVKLEGNTMQFDGGQVAAKLNPYNVLASNGDGIYVKYNGSQGVGIDGGGLKVILNGDRALEFQSGIAVKADSAKALTIDPTSGLRVVADSSKAMAIDATNGLQVVADGNKGMQIDSSAGLQMKVWETQRLGGLYFYNGQLAVAADSESSLTFGANKGLQVVVDDATGALAHVTVPGHSSTALAVRVATSNELTIDSYGLHVKGVPAQFKINGTATSSDVTAANLGTLTATSSGNYSAADALHSHQNIKTQAIAGENIAAGKAVYVSASNTVSTASCSASSTARVVGINRATATAAGVSTVHGYGLSSLFSGLTAGTPYYLGSDGSPVEFSALSSGDRVVRLGFAVNATTMSIAIQDMGQKA